VTCGFVKVDMLNGGRVIEELGVVWGCVVAEVSRLESMSIRTFDEIGKQLRLWCAIDRCLEWCVRREGALRMWHSDIRAFSNRAVYKEG